jgi:RimJ/RimL family protein N-acetyltransferase
MTSRRLVDLWPAAGISVRAGDLEMRWIDDELAVDLALLAGQGVHDDNVMPFNYPWTRGTEREVARSVLTFQWAARPRVGAERLVLELGVLVNGEPVGIQSASGDNWSVLREVETGSWLGRAYQGRGIGRRMRALMLHFCFEALKADSVVSAAFTDNAASNAVSLRTGYVVDGVQRVVRDGIAATQTRYRMDRARWAQVRAINQEILGADVTVAGVDALLADLEQNMPPQ